VRPDGSALARARPSRRRRCRRAATHRSSQRRCSRRGARPTSRCELSTAGPGFSARQGDCGHWTSRRREPHDDGDQWSARTSAHMPICAASMTRRLVVRARRSALVDTAVPDSHVSKQLDVRRSSTTRHRGRGPTHAMLRRGRRYADAVAGYLPRIAPAATSVSSGRPVIAEPPDVEPCLQDGRAARPRDAGQNKVSALRGATTTAGIRGHRPRRTGRTQRRGAPGGLLPR
jgi:hypothetical protein